MIFSRRSLLQMSAATAVLVQVPRSVRAATPGSANGPELGDDGLYIQDWFLDSFLDFSEDFAAAAASGKGLIVLFEQRGCPYCRELHNVNFKHEKLRPYMQKHFDVVQLDIWGSREVTNFDGKAMEERKLASRWAVNFTPTTVLFTGDPKAASGKTGKEAEAARLPGYFKPFHYHSMLEFVAEGHYKKMSFQRYLQQKFREMDAKGIKPNVW